MKRDDINALAREMCALHRARQAQPETRPPAAFDLAHYTDTTQFEDERRVLFRESPLLLAFSSDLPTPGSFKTNDFLEVPVVLVRGKDGIARAFANICRHRSGRVVEESNCMGNRKVLTCRYHGWVFGLDGELKSVSHENLFGRIDKKQHRLIELPCEEKHGMIFVRPSAGARVSVDEHLGHGFAAELAGWNFGNMHFVNATTIETPSNWKLQSDTFLESYHVESLHKSTIGGLSLSGYTLQHGFGPHQRIVFASPSVTTIGDVPDTDLDGHKHLTIVYSIFPNIFIVFGSLWVQYFEIYPGRTIDAQRTRFVLYSRKPPKNDEQREAGQAYFDLNLKFVPTEDYVMGQDATRAVMSGIERRHLVGFGEPALVHFHRHLRSAVGRDPDALFASST
jgi:phenylpropionate dioxygenase-like ring-hydroxylating dioxygenase large terminal subunit